MIENRAAFRNSSSHNVLVKQNQPKSRVSIMAPVLRKKYTNIVMERQNKMMISKGVGQGFTPLDHNLDNTFEMVEASRHGPYNDSKGSPNDAGSAILHG